MRTRARRQRTFDSSGSVLDVIRRSTTGSLAGTSTRKGGEMMRRTIVMAAAALGMVGLIGVTSVPAASARSHHPVAVGDPTIYNSIDNPLPGNNASQAF